MKRKPIDNINNTISSNIFQSIFNIALIIIAFMITGICCDYIRVIFLDSVNLSSIIKELLYYCVYLLFIILLLWLFTKYRNRSPLSSVGFQLKGHYKEIGSNFFLGLILIGSGTICLILAHQITLIPSGFHWQYFAITPIIMLITALNEELLVRGYILRTLMKSCNPYLALYISSALFALLHIPNIIYGNYSCLPLISIFCAGILLGLTYMQTQNIWASVALHFSWNFFQGFVFGFNVSGEEVYSILQPKRIESNFWNGGDFGFEGSVLCVLIFVIVCIFFVSRKRIS